MNLDFIKCLNRCRIHRKKDDFKHFLLDGYHNPNFVEIKENGSEYAGKIIYRITEFGLSNGFFSEVLFLLKKLLYCDARGFIPYVMWGKDCLYYENEGVDGEYNCFLHYFSQTSEVESTDNAAFVIEANDSHLDWVYSTYEAKAYNYPPEYIKELGKMARKYLRYNEHVKEYLESEFDSLIGGKKTLAVHFRGTDYRRQYNNHPVFVTIEEEISTVRGLMESGNYEQIFVATDETEAIQKFVDEFRDKVVYYEDVLRAKEGDESVAFSQNERELHHYKLGLEVMRDQYTLTRCDGLVCGISNLTIASRVMREAWIEKDYDDLVVIEHGFNHNDNRFVNAKH